MTLAFVRILLRCILMMLVSRGLMSQEVSDIISSDPDIAMAVDIFASGLIAALAEWLHRIIGERMRRDV